MIWYLEKVLDEFAKLWRGHQAQICLKEAAETVERTKGLGLVSLGEMDADQGGLGAFAQRISPDGRTGGGRGITEAPRRGKITDQCLQRVETELTPVLCFENDPVVVPYGQQLKGETGNCCRAEVSFFRGSGSEKAVGERPGIVEVDRHALGQFQT